MPYWQGGCDSPQSIPWILPDFVSWNHCSPFSHKKDKNNRIFHELFHRLTPDYIRVSCPTCHVSVSCTTKQKPSLSVNNQGWCGDQLSGQLLPWCKDSVSINILPSATANIILPHYWEILSFRAHCPLFLYPFWNAGSSWALWCSLLIPGEWLRGRRAWSQPELTTQQKSFQNKHIQSKEQNACGTRLVPTVEPGKSFRNGKCMQDGRGGSQAGVWWEVKIA